MKKLFKRKEKSRITVECLYVGKCSNQGTSCRNCFRNLISVVPLEDKLKFNATYVDFVSKNIIGREGEGLEKWF